MPFPVPFDKVRICKKQSKVNFGRAKRFLLLVFSLPVDVINDSTLETLTVRLRQCFT